MESGGAVKLRGVQIGRVTEVAPGGRGAQISLAIEPRYLHLVPADVSVRIVPPTVFGAKYVDLVPGRHPDEPIARDATISGARVTVEINNTFQHLIGVLNAAPPQALNAALSGLATGLDGNGSTIAQLVSLLDTYLRKFNRALPDLDTDVQAGADVVDTYARLAPRLVRIGTDGASVSDTLIRNEASLDALLVTVTGLADSTRTLLQRNETRLTTSLGVLAPTTRLLAEYAPEFPCLLQGLVATNKVALKAGGGGDTGGLNLAASVLPSQDPYTYPRDLPAVAAANAPACYGLPNVPPGTVLPHVAFATGRDPYAGYVTGGGTAGTPGGTPAALATTLFGTLAGLVAAVP
jgi:phospholipid/cholesterol/gamma-HCH transport system substrate-binding protein